MILVENKWRRMVFVICALALEFNSLQARQSPDLVGAGAFKAVVLWNNGASRADSIDQQSFVAVAASMGLPVSKVAIGEFGSSTIEREVLLLVPRAVSKSLSQHQVRLIFKMMEKGLRLVTDGPGPLLKALHCTLGNPVAVHVVVDELMPDNHLIWADRPRVGWISESASGSRELLFADSATGHPLVVTGRLGNGGYIVLASYLDEVSGNGYSRFPTLVSAIAWKLGCRPMFRRQAVDAYFDPGYRTGMSPDSLAARWHSWGIRAVHAAAWYYNDTQVYDYKSLIEAAHKNGVLVYAWLEWPHVGTGFWNLHPEWREKTALLKDAQFDFLHLMDLQNPDCMNAALADLSRLLELDWDGIDIAEFTITGAGGEALEGPSRPDCFTSFGPQMCKEFKEVAGFDPLELENPAADHFWQRDSAGLNRFYQYRKMVNNRLLRHVVESLVAVKKSGSRDWELIHTIVDNSLHPEFDQLLGFDLESTLDLVKEHGMTLNVEDPYMEWTEPPDRYRRLRRTLENLMPEHPSMIDINVVPIHPVTQRGFASPQPTGMELLQQIQCASEEQGRVCLYAESSVFGEDWRLIPHALVNGAVVTREGNGYDVSSPKTVTLELSSPDVVFNNGDRWPCYGSEGIVLPSGSHHLTFHRRSDGSEAAKSDMRVVAITGELQDCEATSTGFEIAYASPSRCLISVSKYPKRCEVDGMSRSLPVFRGRNAFVLMAPSGSHRIAASCSLSTSAGGCQ
jgi:hypothetical protein